MEQKVILVDGFKIRNTLDDDFGIVEKHFYKLGREHPTPYIPEGEVWVDHRYKDEVTFLVEMNEFTFPTATETYAERRALAKKKFCNVADAGAHILRSEERDGLTIRYVDGGVVRRCYDPEFTLGGHDLVYDYIPKNEIWLDEKMDPKEILYIFLHEEVERKLMAEGKPYHIAHEYAIIWDKEERRKQGVGVYPGDETYPWRELSNEEIIKKFYVKD